MTRQETADIAVRNLPRLVGADGAVIFLCDDDNHLELVAYMAPLSSRDLMEAAGAGWIKLAPDAQLPAAEVVQTRQGSVWLDPDGRGSVETLPLFSTTLSPGRLLLSSAPEGPDNLGILLSEMRLRC